MSTDIPFTNKDIDEINKDDPKCKCVGYGYCYAEDKDNNIVRPCTLNETFKSE